MHAMTVTAGAHTADRARPDQLGARAVAIAWPFPSVLYGVALVARLFATA